MNLSKYSPIFCVMLLMPALVVSVNCSGAALCHEASTSVGGAMNVGHAGESYTISVRAIEDADYTGPNSPFVDYEYAFITYSLFVDSQQVGDSITLQGYQAAYQDGAEFTIDSDSPFATNQLIDFQIKAQVQNGTEVHVADDIAIRVNIIPGGSSLVPLIFTLLTAFATKDVYVSLLFGIWIASFIELRYVFFDSIWRVVLFHVSNSFTDVYNAQVIFFSVFLGGCVALLTRSGGARGLAELLGHYASTPKLGQLLTWCAGFLIFFDDYSNAMVVGNSMRPVTDKLGISREKLAFIVDATSAPIASIIPVSSWIAYEVGLIEAQLEKITPAQQQELGFDDSTSGLQVFLASIGFRYYPIVMLCFQLFLIASGLEFGPMLSAERRARYAKYDAHDQALDTATKPALNSPRDEVVHLEDQGLEPEKDTPKWWVNGLVPIAMIVFLIIYFIVDLGLQYCEGACDAADVINSTDSFAALVQGSMASTVFMFLWYGVQCKRSGKIGLLCYPVSAQRQSLMGWRDMVDTYVRGITNLTPAVLVLILAWSMGDAMEAIGTDRFFAEAVNGSVAKELVPALTFVLSALIALATGTSWGTMALMFPLIGGIAAASGSAQLYYSTVGSVLSGAVFGDHCSPISDTTVLSSLASRCDLFAHVQTQAPYAAFVAVFTVIFGDLIGGTTGMHPAGGVLISLLLVLAATLVVSAPVNSKTGRLDLYGRLVLWSHVRFGYEKGTHYLHKLQVKTALAEQTFPTAQFDPLGKVLGGSLSEEDQKHAGNIERIKSSDEAENDNDVVTEAFSAAPSDDQVTQV